MSCNRRTVFLSVMMVWVQGCLAGPLREGSGAFTALKSEKVTITTDTLAYFADQEGSGYSEVSEFSSSSGTNPIYVQMSSMEPSVEEALSSSIYNVHHESDAGTGDSDIVFAESESDTEESIPEDPTMAESDLYELDREENQVGQGVGEEFESQGEGVELDGNEVNGIQPTVTSVTSTSSPGDNSNVIPNGVLHHAPSNTSNDLNIVSSEHGNEVGGHKGHVNDIVDKEVKDENESDDMSGKPGSGIMAVVMFVTAIGVGALLSFMLVGLTKIGKKFFRKNPDP
ncbi:uncharacterized protein LOC119741907 [Patiria miniata]|uniref:Syndecan n=1 Tax=Patiria miniata TaxID=46514 RepID=A0A914BD61_PATMI|nr:uncharacterized protein LOC119741907 [Patiria miniata]